MDQAQLDIRKATPRQIAGVSMRLAVSLMLVFGGVLVASVPFLMQFAKSCPNLLEESAQFRGWTHSEMKCSGVVESAVTSFNTIGTEFIGSLALMLAIVDILRRRRQEIAARRETE